MLDLTCLDLIYIRSGDISYKQDVEKALRRENPVFYLAIYGMFSKEIVVENGSKKMIFQVCLLISTLSNSLQSNGSTHHFLFI